jgi:endo-alpha-1,4-polygalactosaminidase (GH114 family)
MANEIRLLVTQALDERDLLNKKINDKIMSAVFVDVVKHNEETVLNRRVDRETFQKEAQSTYQQINDLIERYKNIEAAIVESNANTFIETSYGKFSIAAAIALRNRLRGDLKFDGKADFETTLYQRMKRAYEDCVTTMELKNDALAETAEQMRLSILGRETKVKNDKPLEVVETYIKENSMELADPLNIVSKMEQLQERKDKLLSELETQIKVSNATTVIVLNA